MYDCYSCGSHQKGKADHHRGTLTEPPGRLVDHDRGEGDHPPQVRKSLREHEQHQRPRTTRTREAEKLTKYYGTRVGIVDVDLEVQAGESSASWDRMAPARRSLLDRKS